MNDEEARAQYYQAHKDDEDEWGEPEQPPKSSKPKRRLASMISVRFSPEETKIVRRAAEAAGESVSQFVRKAALRRGRPLHFVLVSISGNTTKIIGTPSASASTSPWATATKGSPEANEENQWIPKNLNLLGSYTTGYLHLAHSHQKSIAASKPPES
jgi:Family of unknown function (DUF6290)